MPIASPIGFLDVVNATLRASQVESTSRLTVANTAATKNFSVGDRFHIDKDSVDPVSITGNVVASGIKISNLTIGPAFDFASVSNVGNVTANVIQFANATTGFTTTANVEIGGNITLTSNAQVKVGSNVLAEYTGPHGREPKEMPLKKFPEIAFEEGKFDHNTTTNTFIQAGYTITSSGNYSDNVNSQFTAWRAFTGKLNLYNPGWVSPFASYTSGVANSTQSLTNIDTATSTGSVSSRNGAWIKLELPTKIKLGRVDFYDRYDDSGTHTSSGHERVSEAFVYGGNSNSGPWYEIGKQSDATNMAHYTDDNPASLTINTTSYYKYYIIQPTQLAKTLAYGSYGQLMFYGSEEPAPVGDLSLDTTLKSTFNSVRSNNYVMYFDGEDPAAGNVPKYLVSGSAKSITPNNVVFDATNNCWTLNGSTESNVTTGSLGLVGDVPHTVSTWINASNLEANALTQQLFSIGSGYDKAFLKVDDTQISANTWHNVTYAYQGEGGSKVTYVDGRKVEEAQVEDTFGDYPPFAMTGYKTGGYCVSASSTAYTGTDWNTWYLYDDRGSGNSGWHSNNNFNSSDNFAYNGNANLGGQVGEWNKLEMPHKLVLNYFKIRNRGAVSDAVQAPEDFKIIGSNDDVNWTVLFSVTGVTWSGPGVEKIYSITSNSIGYKYLAFLCTRTVGSGALTLNNISYYGHKEGDLTRFPEPTRVLKYPHVTMTGPGQRGYVASASSEYTSAGPFNAWEAFDGITGGSSYWSTFSGTYTTSNTPTLSYTGTTFATNVEGVSKYGEWLQIEFPHKVIYSYSTILAPSDHEERVPRDGYIVGSNDLTGQWTTLHRFEDVTRATTTETVTYTPPSAPTQAFKYFRLVIEAISTGGQNFAGVDTWELYGTQEDTGTPAIVGGPFAGKVANFRVYDQYLGDERIQEIYDAQKDEFGHKKSSMTLYKGRVGVGTTEPEGALTVLDEPHALAKFPARAVSADDSYVEGDGQIKLSAADGSGYQAFDGLTSTSWTATPTRNTRLSEEVDFGAWLKIQTPESISLKKAEIESNPDWNQVGGEVQGSLANDHFGRSVACSHDGTRVIAGGHAHNSSQGIAKVYDWNGTAWTQVGQNLTGVADGNAPQFSRNVAISGDGNIIAVTAPYEHSNGVDSGTVRVYYLNGTTWTILPDSGSLTETAGASNVLDAFVGSAVNVYLGLGSLQLSYDGKTIAMTEYGYDITGKSDVGRALVYKYSNGAWSYKGTGATQFVGDTADAHFGFGMSMSEDGDHLALGTLDGGHFVEVYKWNGSTWNLKGSRINQPSTSGTTNDYFGQVVSISNDGNTLAVGMANADLADGALVDNGGLVLVYHWTGSAWGTPHKLQYNEIADEEFGLGVVLSGDGKRLVVCAGAENNYAGELFTFEYTGGSWVMRTPGVQGLNGYTPDGHLGWGWAHVGHPFTISRDGSTIVAGELGYDTPASNAGRFRVFSMPSNIKSIWGSNDDVNWTKITTGNETFRVDDRLEFKNLDNPNYYKYHAIVADAFTRLKDIKLYGIRNQGSSTLHDGTLTLTKNLDVPRIGPPPDADDTPRRDRLVVEYNTSTNPVEDGLVKDTSGRGNDGVFYGGASYDATEKALVFDGTDDYVSVKASGVKGSSLNTSYSFSIWIKMTNTASAAVFITVGTSASGEMIGLRMSNGTTQYLVYHFAGDSATTGTTYGVSQEWRHVALTWDNSHQRIYIDGVLAVEETASSSFLNIPDNPNINLGMRPDGGGSTEYFKGYQSNPKIYDCTLTAQEVKTLYDMGRCDEGHHVVNFSKTRVGIGLGDGEVPRGDLDVTGDTIFRSRVGIGTNDPGGLLDIRAVASDPSVPTVHIGDNAADFGDYGMVNLVRNPAAAGSKAHLAFIRNGNTVFSQGFYNDTNTFGFWPSFGGVTNTPAMSFATNGNVGIGITNPPAKLYVKTTGSASMGGSWNTTDFVVSHGVGTTAPTQSLGVAIGVDGTGDAGTSRGYLWCMRPNLTWNTLKIQGNVIEIVGLASITSNRAITNTSDDRLKTEEEFLQNALPTIMKLKPQTYRKHPFLPNDPSKEVTENMTEMPSDLSQLETGLIVQDIWYDAPELRHLVKLGDNANPPEVRPVDPDPSDPTQDPDYSSWGTTPTNLEYQGVFVVALKAIQELNTELQTERAKVATLETQLASVLTRLDALENA